MGQCVNGVQDIVGLWSNVSFEIQSVDGDLAIMKNILDMVPQTINDCSSSDIEEMETNNPEGNSVEFCIFEDPYENGGNEEESQF